MSGQKKARGIAYGLFFSRYLSRSGTMFGTEAWTFPSVHSAPAFFTGTSLRHVVGIRKLSAIGPAPATAIIQRLRLHDAILSEVVATF